MSRAASGAWFRVSKNAWYATVHGRQTSLGIRGNGKGKEAEAARAWHRLMVLGPTPKPLPKPDKVTVDDVIESFLSDARTRLKPTTVRIYGEYLRRFRSSYGTKAVCQVDPAMIRRWMLGTGTTGTTHGIALRSLSACLGWATMNGMLTENPCKKVMKPKSRSRSTEAVITEADHARLLEAASPEFALVLTVLHATGCRPGEAASMTAENFDPANGVVRLEIHKSDRSGKPRLIFLPPTVVELLKTQVERFRTGALLRSNKGVPWKGRSITQAMMRLCRKVGLKHFAYGYRHSFATRLLSRGGVPDAHVAALLGHSSTAMLHKHYSHLTSQADVLRGSLGKLDT